MASAQDDQGFRNALWAATARPAPDCPALDSDIQADIVIVGAGFAGLSAALHLAERGHRPVVLEAQQPGWGASGRNGGQVIAGLKHDLTELEHLVGAERAARMIAFSDHTAEATFALIDRLGIDCDAIRGGWFQGAHSKAALEIQRRKVERLTARGVSAAILTGDEMRAMVGTDWYPGGLFDARGGTLQPLSLARGLARAAIAAGARIHGETPVARLKPASDGWTLLTRAGHTVSAGKVLLCTNAYSDIADLQHGITRSVVPFYSYQIATAPLSDNLLKTLPAQGLGLSETRRVLAYCRVDADGRFVMGARGALDGSLDPRAFNLTRQRLRELYPHLADIPVESHWNGRVAVTTDSLPRLVEPAPNLHAALGWNGRGVAMTTAMGPVLADWLTGTPRDDLPMPVTPLRPIPFHWMKRPASAVAVLWKTFLDRRERAA